MCGIFGFVASKDYASGSERLGKLASELFLLSESRGSEAAGIAIADSSRSEERVAMRVSQGGHDVPTEKLLARFPRTLANLREAIRDLPHVLVFDNDDLRAPFRQVAVFQNGDRVRFSQPVPAWLAAALAPQTSARES